MEFKHKIQAEKATLKAIMVTCHPNVTEDNIQALIAAVQEIASERETIDDVIESEEEPEPLYVSVLGRR